MAETGLTFRTFYNRMFKCYYYKDRIGYIKTTTLLFNRILTKYSQDTSKSLLDLFATEFSNNSFTGINAIYSNDVIGYKEYCILCIKHLSEFFDKNKTSHINDRYNYKYKIKGSIGCRLKDYNVHFFYKNIKDSEKEIDFAVLNNYIYNQVSNLSNSCLIMSVPTNSFYLVKYNEMDYTMGRGFLVQTKITKLRKQGEHCIGCKHSCKPLFINGQDRLNIHL